MRTLIRGSPAVFVLALAWATDNVEVVDVVAVCAAIQRQVNLKDAYPGKNPKIATMGYLAPFKLCPSNDLATEWVSYRRILTHTSTFHQTVHMQGIVCDCYEVLVLAFKKSKF